MTRFSIVSAVYDVAAYLPDFIDSIEAQTHDLADVEVLMVDDGSRDASPALLAEWAARRPDLVTVIRQENAGQGAARNTGIAAATGEWITFPDPDDTLGPQYLAAVAGFLDAHPDADMVATNRWIWDEKLATKTNSHPLRFMFRGSPYVDMVADGQRFQGSAPATFFRRDRIIDLTLTFDERVRPIFEDGHFTCRYLLGFERPMAGFLGTARYNYRKRADGSSTLQTARTHPGRYTDVLEHGYLDVVRIAQERHGVVPSWLRSHLVFDLSWYFTLTDSQAPLGTPTDGPVAARMHDLMAQLLGAIDVDVSVPFSTAPVTRVPRLVLQHGYRDEPWIEPTIALEELDEDRHLLQASWYFTGPLPVEDFRSDGTPIPARHIKTRSFTYCGRTLLHKRIAWFPADTALEIHLDSAPRTMTFRRPPLPTQVARPGQVRHHLSPTKGRSLALAEPFVAPTPTSRDGRLAQRLMNLDRLTARYRDAWVFMDRIHNAGDSAEVMFRHVRATHPEINAWFVLEKGTPEWDRFVAEGEKERLLAHGSLRWRLLMAHARHLISSHVDEAIIRPPQITEFTHPRWLNHFLNHGLIKDDLSAWLNAKPLASFVTSSVAEHASIAGDETSYTFTTREVHNTGMPRFDRLLATGLRYPPERRDLVLVTPTWRNHLIPPPELGSQRRDADLAVLDSDFVVQWRTYVERLAAEPVLTDAGLRIGFLPHPNLASLLPHLRLPEQVEVLTYEGHDVQEYFARARVLVTDFSSIAFNAAYLERPLVYFQFDEDIVLEGGHVGRRGYFDYRRDGFGPVETTCDGAVQATLAAIKDGPSPTRDYLARIEATFPLRDGGCSERVVEVVRASVRADAGPVPTPVLPPPVTVESR